MSHRIWSFAALVASMLSQLASTVSAGLVFSDDFENYADQSAFAANWSAVGNPPHVLDTGFGYNSNQSLRLGPQGSGNGTSNRWYRNLSVPMVPTDVTPVLFRFDFYLDPSGESTNWLSDWQLADVRGYGGGTFGSGSIDAVVAIGVDPPGGQNLDSYSAHFFQGRVLNTVQRGATYYSLDALPTAVPRSSGWHTLAAQIGNTHIDFFVDGLPAESVNQGIATVFDTVVLGSDRELIFLTICRITIAPVTGGVAAKSRLEILIGKLADGVRCRHNLTKREFGRCHHLCRTVE